MANNLRIPQIFKLLLFSIILTTLASYKIFANPDTSSFAPNYLPTLDIPYYNGSIKIDGKLDDEGWKIANIASNFSEASPGDRIKPKVDTKVLTIYILLLSATIILKKLDILILIGMHHSMMIVLGSFLILMEMLNGLMRYC